MSAKKYPFKRLLAGELRKHYVRKGVRAVATWFSTHTAKDGETPKHCGCAFTVRTCTKAELDGNPYVDLCPVRRYGGRPPLGEVIVERAKALGFLQEYIDAFIAGFDQGTGSFYYHNREHEPEITRVGVEDGVAARHLLIKNGLWDSDLRTVEEEALAPA